MLFVDLHETPAKAISHSEAMSKCNTSFKEVAPDMFVGTPYENRFKFVEERPRPEISETQRFDGRAAPKQENGQWFVEWIVRDETEEEKETRKRNELRQIENELQTIDSRSIRTLREGNAVLLAQLEADAAALRVKWREINNFLGE